MLRHCALAGVDDQVVLAAGVHSLLDMLSSGANCTVPTRAFPRFELGESALHADEENVELAPDSQTVLVPVLGDQDVLHHGVVARRCKAGHGTVIASKETWGKARPSPLAVPCRRIERRKDSRLDQLIRG